MPGAFQTNEAMGQEAQMNRKIQEDSAREAFRYSRVDKDLEEIKELELAQQAIDDPIGYEQGVINQFIDGELNEANGYS